MLGILLEVVIGPWRSGHPILVRIDKRRISISVRPELAHFVRRYEGLGRDLTHM